MNERGTSSYDGGLLLDKPSGLTSHDVVARVRKTLGVRKCGHTGTLDPFATGLLVLCLGRATRLARFVSSQPKSYVAGVRFGFATDTYDRTGKPLGEDSGAVPSETELVSALEARIGRHEQIPPPFSAKKIQGRRAYALARAGDPVAPEPVEVQIYEAVLEELSPPSARIRLRVSSGTYIRSLAHDLGEAFGSGAHLETLRRVSVGSLGVADAMTLETLEEARAEGRVSGRLLEPNALLVDLPPVAVGEEEARDLAHGRHAPAGGSERKGPFRAVDPEGRLVAVCEVREETRRPLVVWSPAGGTP